ncbi:hypothetical protein A2524_01960 [Candidatus Wolfebacteria bacterium RIFOXYD12_FULL_48_21]|uniref:Uncharacterized protein n=1 Tax=Candidatus Wolfebacteria bacterium RIFOXYD1_FULL_48_65 TaxID=1802561 RepID=A0A1F8DZM7_9BACT|nr:MAG: hypothetical protein A2610_03935 [Candidatus Wolfebacteria bacterium RIFOXYD1_FULL_48_65]OGM94560.1 MAG: hypothetical protein A2524_01960 [Candidatus Wolfebacteria bacterium RIFOXYD12_FULL_48_21]
MLLDKCPYTLDSFRATPAGKETLVSRQRKRKQFAMIGVGIAEAGAEPLTIPWHSSKRVAVRWVAGRDDFEVEIVRIGILFFAA